MIDPRAIAYILGQFLLALAGTMLIPLIYGAATDGRDLDTMALGAAITGVTGGALFWLVPRPTRELSQREGLLMVVAVWGCVAAFGCLPFYFSPYFSSFTDAFFEAASGFTTTGATVLDDVEVLSRTLQFWRCFSHWLGGMGVVLLVVAVLPLVGHGGMHLYRAEFSGAKSERLRPRVAETAVSLWRIYFALSLAEFTALRFAGMDSFEAMCHTFSTLGTGGFSTRTASIAGFQSPLIEYIIIVFMALAGMSFIQHYHFWVQGRFASLFRDVEVRAYVVLIALGTVLIGGFEYLTTGGSWELTLRESLFQVVSIITTTGFVTADYEIWHSFSQLLLLALMFIGGCTGSTAGGMKVSRILLLARVVDREFKRMVERHGVFSVRLGNDVIPEVAIQSLLNLVYLAFLVNFVSCLLLAAMGIDVLTSIAAVAASMFNIGPGLGSVGPLDNFGHLPALAKWVLAADMIAGRLEFYTVLVILTPWFWRK